MAEENKRNESIEKSVVSKIKKIGYSYEDLDDKERNYLFIVEECIANIFDRENQAKALLTKNNVSIKNVSEQTKIARQTFYNVPLLSEYITYRNKEFEKIDLSLIHSANHEEIQRLKSDIEVMRKRDVDIEELKIDIELLKQKLKIKDDTILSLRNRLER